MKAVIHTGGKQYLISPGEKIKIEKLEIEVGKSVSFDKVLLLEDEKGNLSLGTPYISGVKVVGKILETKLGEKVRVFKYKPKTRYKIKQGHRQPYTEVEIEKITTK
jgi:large subunit ribosomal protein L21